MDKQKGMHPAIKLRHLRAFLDIAADGGLTSVARRRGITQPALSRSLAEMETLLGQALFLRQGRRLVLTEWGKLFRRHAATALEVLDAGASMLQPGLGGRLRIGILPTVASRFFPAVALQMRELRPGIILTVETGPHQYLMRQLREGAIDLMIGRLPGGAEMAGLVFEHLYEEDVVLVGRPGHPLRDRPVAEALAGSGLILPPETALIRPSVDAYLASLGLAGQLPEVETVSLALGRALCMGSDLLWFISVGVVQQELARGDLIQFPIGARFMSGAVGMTRRQGTDLPGLVTLTELAKDLAADLDGEPPA